MGLSREHFVFLSIFQDTLSILIFFQCFLLHLAKFQAHGNNLVTVVGALTVTEMFPQSWTLGSIIYVGQKSNHFLLERACEFGSYRFFLADFYNHYGFQRGSNLHSAPIYIFLKETQVILILKGQHKRVPIDGYMVYY